MVFWQTADVDEPLNVNRYFLDIEQNFWCQFVKLIVLQLVGSTDACLVDALLDDAREDDGKLQAPAGWSRSTRSPWSSLWGVIDNNNYNFIYITSSLCLEHHWFLNYLLMRLLSVVHKFGARLYWWNVKSKIWKSSFKFQEEIAYAEYKWIGITLNIMRWRWGLLCIWLLH